MKGVLWGAALACVAAVAAADVVHLKSGGRVEGVVREQGDVVEVTGAAGTVKIPRAQIDRIEAREYVPPARPRGDEPPAAPEMGETFREPFLGFEIRIPYGWIAQAPSRGSVFTFYGPMTGKYRPKMDVQAKRSSQTRAEFLDERRQAFAATFPGSTTTPEAGFQADGTEFEAFSASLRAEGLELHGYQAVGEAGELRILLSLICQPEEKDGVREQAARAFATFRRVPAITEDRDLADRFRAHMEEGSAQYKEGDTEGAIRAYRQAAQELPEHPMPWQNLGLIFASRNRMDEAVEAYRTLCRLLPDSVAAHYHLASLFRQQGKYEDARVAYEKVLVLDPRHADCWVNLCALYQMKGDTALAVRCAKTAIAIAPDMASAHFNLAQLYNLMQRTREAIEEYKRTLQIEPDHRLAKEELRRLGE